MCTISKKNIIATNLSIKTFFGKFSLISHRSNLRLPEGARDVPGDLGQPVLHDVIVAGVGLPSLAAFLPAAGPAPRLVVLDYCAGTYVVDL